MPYLSSFERTAIKEGMQQEVQRLLTQILNIKFKKIPDNLMEKINNITDINTLEMLHYQAVLCNSIEDFENNLDSIVSK
jgi:hypothetical protein